MWQPWIKARASASDGSETKRLFDCEERLLA